MSERISDKDIKDFQRQTRWVKPPKIIVSDVETEKGRGSDLSAAQRWAQVRSVDGFLSDGESLDGRFTAIKSNIVAGDLKSAVLGLIGALQERVDKLSAGGDLYNDDGRLIRFLVCFRIEKLSEDSPITKMFQKYREMVRDY